MNQSVHILSRNEPSIEKNKYTEWFGIKFLNRGTLLLTVLIEKTDL